jgi:hypothetical protein
LCERQTIEVRRSQEAPCACWPAFASGWEKFINFIDLRDPVTLPSRIPGEQSFKPSETPVSDRTGLAEG